MQKRKYWSEQDIQFLKDNIKNMSIEELAKHFNVSYSAIATKIHKIGISKKSYGFYWTSEEDQIIIQHFEYAPKEYLMRMLPNRSWLSIFQRGSSFFNLQRKSQDKYYLNYNFFSEWNENVAYIIGLIAADGHLRYHSSKNNSNSLELELSASDIDILNKICSLLETNKPLIYNKVKNTYKLSISNVKIIEDLISKGIPYKNKTTSICFPTNMPTKYNKDYIRGIMDGDGSIYTERSNNRLHLQFLGSKSMISSIQKFIPIDITDLTIIDLYDSHSCYKLSVSGKRALEILTWLYKDSNLYFQRKHDIYLSYLSSSNSPCIQ